MYEEKIKPICNICKEYTCCVCRVKSSPVGKWRYECYICGARSEGQGELFKSCDCNHGPTIKCYRP